MLTGRNGVFVIAEVGSNHNGDLDTALRLIHAAARAGADAVKFQSFRAHMLYPPGPERDRLVPIEVPAEWLPHLALMCDAESVAFLSTPFDEQAVKDLYPYVPAYKVASTDITNVPLLRAIADTHKEVIISTGGASMREIALAVRDFDDRTVSLLQCTVEYPTPVQHANLLAIPTMKEAFGVPVGFSDHTEGIAAAIAAVALGAEIVEKHFTLDRTQPGPDHGFAADPRTFATMVAGIRAASSALGTVFKHGDPQASLSHLARRVVFSTAAIWKGEPVCRTAVLRGTGDYAPAWQEGLRYKKAAKDIPAWKAIQWSDVE